MPIIEDTNELIVLTKKVWEELDELDLGAFNQYENGVSIRERRIIIKNIRCLIEENEEIFYPYISYYDEEGKEKVERLVQTDKKFRILKDGEVIFQSKNLLEIVTEFNRGTRSEECVITDTLSVHSWINRIKKRLPNLSQTYFPMPVIIRHKRNYTHERFAKAKRDSYFIIPLDLEPEYLGECKYRG